ncbi:MAG: hypothetical protein M5T61_11440 [Acidimicrobiia bacterium]|nr:hypothetical protein [Acidimicrobiia bacterium]
MSTERIERRLRNDSRCRLEQGEEISAWSRAWVSRDRPMRLLLAARHRDFAVVTDRRLLLVSTGFFSRLPRRRVLADRLDEITVAQQGRRPGRCLRVESPAHASVLIELDRSDRSVAFADALLRSAAPEGHQGAPAGAPAEDG